MSKYLVSASFKDYTGTIEWDDQTYTLNTDAFYDISDAESQVMVNEDVNAEINVLAGEYTNGVVSNEAKTLNILDEGYTAASTSTTVTVSTFKNKENHTVNLTSTNGGIDFTATNVTNGGTFNLMGATFIATGVANTGTFTVNSGSKVNAAFTGNGDIFLVGALAGNTTISGDNDITVSSALTLTSSTIGGKDLSLDAKVTMTDSTISVDGTATLSKNIYVYGESTLSLPVIEGAGYVVLYNGANLVASTVQGRVYANSAVSEGVTISGKSNIKDIRAQGKNFDINNATLTSTNIETTTGEGVLTITNSTVVSSTVYVRNQGKLELADSTLTADTLDVKTTSASFKMDVDSTIIAGTIAGTGKITINAADLAEGSTCQVIDITGTEAFDTDRVELINAADNVRLLTGANGDVWVTNVAPSSNLYVNSAWTTYDVGDLISYEYKGETLSLHYGIDAFSDGETATALALSATENGTTITLLADTTIYRQNDLYLNTVIDKDWKNVDYVTADPVFSMNIDGTLNAYHVIVNGGSDKSGKFVVSETGKVIANNEDVRLIGAEMTVTGTGAAVGEDYNYDADAQVSGQILKLAYGSTLTAKNTVLTFHGYSIGNGDVAQIGPYWSDEEGVGTGAKLSLDNTTFAVTGHLDASAGLKTNIQIGQASTVELKNGSKIISAGPRKPLIGINIQDAASTLSVNASSIDVDSVTNKGTFSVSGASTIKVGSLEGTLTLDNAALSGFEYSGSWKEDNKAVIKNLSGTSTITDSSITVGGFLVGSYDEVKDAATIGNAKTTLAGTTLRVYRNSYRADDLGGLFVGDWTYEGEETTDKKLALEITEGSQVEARLTTVDDGGSLLVTGEGSKLYSLETAFNSDVVITDKAQVEVELLNIRANTTVSEGAKLSFVDINTGNRQLNVRKTLTVNASTVELNTAQSSKASAGGYAWLRVYGDFTLENKSTLTMGHLKNYAYDANHKIEIDANGSITVTGSTFDAASEKVTNNGTITIDAFSTFTAKSITMGDGSSIIIDASKLKTVGVKKIIDLSSADGFDTSKVSLSAGSPDNLKLAFSADGDVWITPNVDQSTLYVNGAWTINPATGEAYGFGDQIVLADGSTVYYGINAFANVDPVFAYLNEGVGQTTKLANLSAISFATTAGDTKYSGGYIYADKDVSLKPMDAENGSVANFSGSVFLAHAVTQKPVYKEGGEVIDHYVLMDGDTEITADNKYTVLPTFTIEEGLSIATFGDDTFRAGQNVDDEGDAAKRTPSAANLVIKGSLDGRLYLASYSSALITTTGRKGRATTGESDLIRESATLTVNGTATADDIADAADMTTDELNTAAQYGAAYTQVAGGTVSLNNTVAKSGSWFTLYDRDEGKTRMANGNALFSVNASYFRVTGWLGQNALSSSISVTNGSLVEVGTELRNLGKGNTITINASTVNVGTSVNNSALIILDAGNLTAATISNSGTINAYAGSNITTTGALNNQNGSINADKSTITADSIYTYGSFVATNDSVITVTGSHITNLTTLDVTDSTVSAASYFLNGRDADSTAKATFTGSTLVGSIINYGNSTIELTDSALTRTWGTITNEGTFKDLGGSTITVKNIENTGTFSIAGTAESKASTLTVSGTLTGTITLLDGAKISASSIAASAEESGLSVVEEATVAFSGENTFSAAITLADDAVITIDATSSLSANSINGGTIELTDFADNATRPVITVNSTAETAFTADVKWTYKDSVTGEEKTYTLDGATTYTDDKKFLVQKSVTETATTISVVKVSGGKGTLVVNSDWSTKSAGDVVSDKEGNECVIGYNAFGDAASAIAAIVSQTTTLKFENNNEISEYTLADYTNLTQSLTIDSDAVKTALLGAEVRFGVDTDTPPNTAAASKEPAGTYDLRTFTINGNVEFDNMGTGKYGNTTLNINGNVTVRESAWFRANTHTIIAEDASFKRAHKENNAGHLCVYGTVDVLGTLDYYTEGSMAATLLIGRTSYTLPGTLNVTGSEASLNIHADAEGKNYYAPQIASNGFLNVTGGATATFSGEVKNEGTITVSGESTLTASIITNKGSLIATGTAATKDAEGEVIPAKKATVTTAIDNKDGGTVTLTDVVIDTNSDSFNAGTWTVKDSSLKSYSVTNYANEGKSSIDADDTTFNTTRITNYGSFDVDGGAINTKKLQSFGGTFTVTDADITVSGYSDGEAFTNNGGNFSFTSTEGKTFSAVKVVNKAGTVEFGGKTTLTIDELTGTINVVDGAELKANITGAEEGDSAVVFDGKTTGIKLADGSDIDTVAKNYGKLSATDLKVKNLINGIAATEITESVKGTITAATLTADSIVNNNGAGTNSGSSIELTGNLKAGDITNGMEAIADEAANNAEPDNKAFITAANITADSIMNFGTIGSQNPTKTHIANIDLTGDLTNGKYGNVFGATVSAASIVNDGEIVVNEIHAGSINNKASGENKPCGVIAVDNGSIVIDADEIINSGYINTNKGGSISADTITNNAYNAETNDGLILTDSITADGTVTNYGKIVLEDEDALTANRVENKGGEFTVNGKSVIEGNVVVSGGKVTFNGDVTAANLNAQNASATININNATVSVSEKVYYYGTIVATDSVLDGIEFFDGSGTLKVVHSSIKGITLNGGTMQLDKMSLADVTIDGAFDVVGDSDFSGVNFVEGLTVSEGANLTISAAATITSLTQPSLTVTAGDLVNHGTITIDADGLEWGSTLKQLKVVSVTGEGKEAFSDGTITVKNAEDTMAIVQDDGIYLYYVKSSGETKTLFVNSAWSYAPGYEFDYDGQHLVFGMNAFQDADDIVFYANTDALVFVGGNTTPYADLVWTKDDVSVTIDGGLEAKFSDIKLGSATLTGDISANNVTFTGAAVLNGTADVAALTIEKTLAMDWINPIEADTLNAAPASITIDLSHDLETVGKDTAVIDTNDWTVAQFESAVADYDKNADIFKVVEGALMLDAAAIGKVFSSEAGKTGIGYFTTVADAVSDEATTRILIDSNDLVDGKVENVYLRSKRGVVLSSAGQISRSVFAGGYDVSTLDGVKYRPFSDNYKHVGEEGEGAEESTNVTINGGTYNGYVIGADMILLDTAKETNVLFYRTGDSNLTINAGDFKASANGVRAIAGGMMYAISGSGKTGRAGLVGDVNLTINGGKFYGFNVYGGNYANNNKNYGTFTSIEGNITVTLDASKQKLVFEKNSQATGIITAGSYGPSSVDGSTKVVLTGSNGIEFQQLIGGCSGDIYSKDTKTDKWVNESMVTGSRTLSFTGFYGDLDFANIHGFDTVSIEGANEIDFEGEFHRYFNDEVTNWKFIGEASLNNADPELGYESSVVFDFSGDTINLEKAVTGFELSFNNVKNGAEGLATSTVIAGEGREFIADAEKNAFVLTLA